MSRILIAVALMISLMVEAPCASHAEMVIKHNKEIAGCIEAIKEGDFSRMEGERAKFILAFDGLRTFGANITVQWGAANNDFSMANGLICYGNQSCFYTSRVINDKIVINGEFMADKVIDEYRGFIRRYFISLTTDETFNPRNDLLNDETFSSVNGINIRLTAVDQKEAAKKYYSEIPLALIPDPKIVHDATPDKRSIYFCGPLIGATLYLVGLQWKDGRLYMDMSHYSPKLKTTQHGDAPEPTTNVDPASRPPSAPTR